MQTTIPNVSVVGAALVIAWLVWPHPAWGQADPAKIAKGEKVYADKKCGICHMTKGRGGKAGPDLSEVGAKRDAQWLKAFMKDPKATNPKAKMMPFKGSEEELEAVVASMAALK